MFHSDCHFNLKILFESSPYSLRCPECDSAVDPDDICQDETDNAMFRCSVYCLSGHLIVRWASQPVLGKMAAGNLLTCAAILFSGQTYTHVSQFASF